MRCLDQYLEKTTTIVTEQLRKWLLKSSSIEQEIEAWGRWINIWSQFTFESFLESNIHGIKAKVRGDDQEDLDLDTLGKLLPWTNDAVRGYSVSSYTQQLDESLVQYLRNQMGMWSSSIMHCIYGGMHSLPEAFFHDGILDKSEDVVFNKTVSKITYTYYKDVPNTDSVTVTCDRHSGQPIEYRGKVNLYRVELLCEPLPHVMYK